MLAVNQHPDRLDITWEGRPLCTYLLRDDDPPHLFRRPYLHPVYTLDGDLVTDCRPADHPWHKGISMTMSVVNDQNFWGGPTYRDGQYVQLDNVGEVRHEGWGNINLVDTTLFVEHTLNWLTTRSELWWNERRKLHIDVHPSRALWVVEWQSEFTNISGHTLRLSSPAIEGRASAGYTGLFWRGAPKFLTAMASLKTIESYTLIPAELNGVDASLLGLSIPERDGHHPIHVWFAKFDAHSSFPVRWFVRAQEYPGVAFSFAFDKALEVAPGDTFSLSHSIYVWGRPSAPAEA
jgi:hypothetical protein